MSNETQLTRPIVTEEIVKAKFNQELIKEGYQTRLQSIESYSISEENIEEAQKYMKKGRELLSTLKDIHETGKKPARDEATLWDNVHNSFKKTLENVLADKNKVLQEVAGKKAERERKEAAEQKRKDDIQEALTKFILDQSTAIALATTDEQIVVIEKLIGANKNATSKWQEFLPDYIKRAEELIPFIKKQKEVIRESELLKKQEQEAIALGDDEKILELQEKKEVVAGKISEAKDYVQNTAMNQATRSSSWGGGSRQVFSAPKARLTKWEMEIVDEKKAFAAGMLVCELNKEKAKEELERVKSTIEKGKEKEGVIVAGVRYYQSEKF